MDFPRYVFTSPGNLSAGWGRTYGEEIVNDEAEYEAALKAGFCGTLSEALEGAKNPKKPEPVKAEDSKAEEAKADELADTEIAGLKAKAESLGIKIDNRWKAGRLAEEIAKAEGVADAVRE
jgi:hypothetical protein